MDATLIRRPRTGWPVALVVRARRRAGPRFAGGRRTGAFALPPTLPPQPSADLRTSTIEADSASLRDDGVSVVEGNVVLRSPGRTITSDRMNYDPDAERAEASGRVTVRERDVYLEGRTGGGEPRDRRDGARGRDVPPSRRRTAGAMRNASRTTPGARSCPAVRSPPATPVRAHGGWRPDRSCWTAKAESGTARHARLRFFELPILYAPWISFPHRQTAASPDSSSRPSRATDRIGTSLTVPLYLNLAPNYDATLRPQTHEPARCTARRAVPPPRRTGRGHHRGGIPARGPGHGRLALVRFRPLPAPVRTAARLAAGVRACIRRRLPERLPERDRGRQHRPPAAIRRAGVRAPRPAPRSPRSRTIRSSTRRGSGSIRTAPPRGSPWNRAGGSATGESISTSTAS